MNGLVISMYATDNLSHEQATLSITLMKENMQLDIRKSMSYKMCLALLIHHCHKQKAQRYQNVTNHI
jgi:hypothetical protein